jgi:TrmH family RNA methyltransferase
MRAITSSANPSFRRWLALANSPRAIRESGVTLAEGAHLIQSALAVDWPIEGILMRRGSGRDARILRLLASLEQRSTPAFELAASLYDRLAPVERGVGIMAIVATHAVASRLDAGGDALFIDGLQDPGNAGALVRVAAAAGVKRVLSGVGTTALWSPKALRAGQGAHFSVGIAESVPFTRLRQETDVVWIGTASHDAEPLWESTLPDTPIGWMVGAEGRGLSGEARAACTKTVRIPIDPLVESLNVVAAAAVCLFERNRQRRRSLSSK